MYTEDLHALDDLKTGLRNRLSCCHPHKARLLRAVFSAMRSSSMSVAFFSDVLNPELWQTFRVACLTSTKDHSCPRANSDFVHIPLTDEHER